MLHVLTPTDQRPEAFALLEGWVGRQDWPGPFRWIVGTRDSSPYTFRLNQVVVDRPSTRGLHPLPSNILACFDALDMEPGDLALVMEDDDYYAPDYFQRMTGLAEGVSLAGESHAKYYHVGSCRYRHNQNSAHASLAQTAFRAEAAGLLRAIALRGAPSLDRPLWREWTGTKRLGPSASHVGLKGLPGAPGIGSGHRPHFGIPDVGGRVFRQWGIPTVYRQFAWHGANRREGN